MDIVSFGLASKVSKAIETLIGNSKITIPSGTTAERPVLPASNKAIRFNTDTNGLESWNGTEWGNISANVTSVTIKGTDTEANILLKSGDAGDVWVASDTLDGWLYDGAVWINLGPLKGDTGATGIQGIQGITGNGISSVALTNTVGNTKTYTITFTDTSTTTFDVVDGVNGVNGQDVDHVSRTSGTGAAGTTDTYTVWLDAGETISAGTFNVYNGADGLGVGDMVKSIYDPTNITASVFDTDNHVSGTTNKVYTATEQTKLSGIAAGAQVNDANTTLQGNTFNGVSQLVQTTADGKLPILDGSNLTGVSTVNTLADLTDITITALTDAQVLTYDSGTGKWVNAGSTTSENLINTPTITSPTTGAIDFIGAVTATYATASNYAGAQDYVKWEAGNSDFSTIYDSYEGSSNLTIWAPSIGLPLTTAYVRVKQGSGNHRSEWSSTINFTTPNISIATPMITSPIDGAIDVSLIPTIVSSAYSIIGSSETHFSTDWEIATDSGFTTIVKSSLNDTTHLTSWTIPTSLAPNIAHYIRVRYKSATYTSSWSNTVNFTTLNVGVVTPTITAPIAEATDVLVTPTITTSGYNFVGGSETNISTDWEIATDSGFTNIVKSSLADTVNLTSWTPTALNDMTGYYVRARHKSVNYTSNWSASVHFTTVDVYVQTPTLTVTGTPTDVPETPMLTTSAFSVFNGSDTHTGTTFTVKDGGTTVWTETKTTGDLLTTTVPAGVLEVSVEYTFEAFHTGATYGNSGPTINTGTTKASFSIQYGLQWNNTADTYTRLGAAANWTTGADFTNNETIQSLMRRCVLNTNGTVNYYLSATDSTKKADGVTATDLTGASGNVMVEIPKFWVKYDNTTSAKQMWISTGPSAGYVVHPAFVKNGVEVDYRYYRAYKGSVSGAKLISRSGVAAAGNETIVAFRTKARSNGTGWGLVDWNLLFAVQTLLFIEIGTFNSQAVLGNGNDTGSDYGMTTGGSNSIGNASSPATNDDTWMSYRGIENFYADIFEWIDGVNFSERLVYTSNTQSTFASDLFSGTYTSTGVTLPSSGYISDMNFSTKGFIPTTSGGSDSTYVTDYVNSATGPRVASFGGFTGSGLQCGAAFLNAPVDSSFASSAVGAGLSF